MNKLTIAVCGCGPAGLAAALLLHRAGHAVTLFERFARPKPVGSGLLLQPTGLAVIERLGLLEKVLALGARIDRMFGRDVSGNRVALDMRFSALGSGWAAIGIHRAALFSTLYDALLSERIPIVPNMPVDSLEYAGSQVTPCSNSKRIGSFSLLVDALGARTPLLRSRARSTLEYGALWINVPFVDNSFGASALEQRYRRAAQMAGVLPIGRPGVDSPSMAAFFWSLKKSAVTDWRRAGIERWRADVRALWPEAESLIAHVRDTEELTFAEYDHFTARTPYQRQVAHIGDAAHSTSPQLGQGANMALLDAFALARAIEDNEDVDRALADYARLRRAHIRLFQLASRIFTPFYQSDSLVLPWLRDWIAVPASRLPIGATLVARLISGMTVAPLRGVNFSPLRVGESTRSSQ